MSEPIQSISQGNYILHNIDAKKLYVQEPLFTANSGDAVYVGWRPDETVLWEGTMSASGVSASYSEPALNFEYLRFIGSTNDSPPTNAFIIETPTYPISASTQGVTYGSTMFAANWGLKAISMKSSDTEFTKYVEREMSYTNTAWSNYECHYNIYKVIGINRKENA